MVKETMEAVRREMGVKPTQKAAATIDIAALLADHVKIGPMTIRDRAMLLLGFYTGSRRSEITGLNIEDVSIGKRGVTVFVRKSKGDQLGEGMTKFIPPSEVECVDAIRALVEQLKGRGVNSGPLFRPVSRSGTYRNSRLLNKYVALLVKQTVLRAYQSTGDERLKDASVFSGHSLRAGLVTTLAERGNPIHVIQKKTGHASKTVEGYIRDRGIVSQKDIEADPTFNLFKTR
jgi:integrase